MKIILKFVIERERINSFYEIEFFIGLGIKSKDPLTFKERITLLPLNYTRYNAIIVWKWNFCRITKFNVIKKRKEDKIIIQNESIKLFSEEIPKRDLNT